jgi:hypothetical protein
VLLIVLVVSGMQERFFLEMARAGILVNLVMWAFNLFPLPPLDGGRILVGPAAFQAGHRWRASSPWLLHRHGSGPLPAWSAPGGCAR